eukprot:scaffold23434_cov135-Isochrysis_galbana.AAC.8
MLKQPGLHRRFHRDHVSPTLPKPAEERKLSNAVSVLARTCVRREGFDVDACAGRQLSSNLRNERMYTLHSHQMAGPRGRSGPSTPVAQFRLGRAEEPSQMPVDSSIGAHALQELPRDQRRYAEGCSVGACSGHRVRVSVKALVQQTRRLPLLKQPLAGAAPATAGASDVQMHLPVGSKAFSWLRSRAATSTVPAAEADACMIAWTGDCMSHAGCGSTRSHTSMGRWSESHAADESPSSARLSSSGRQRAQRCFPAGRALRRRHAAAIRHMLGGLVSSLGCKRSPAQRAATALPEAWSGTGGRGIANRTSRRYSAARPER